VWLCLCAALGVFGWRCVEVEAEAGGSVEVEGGGGGAFSLVRKNRKRPRIFTPLALVELDSAIYFLCL